ncbi:MAG: helix-turn-helix domain-containing protein [Thermoproteus sp.]
MEEKLLSATLNIVRQHGVDLFLDVSRPYAYTMVVEHEDKKILLKIAVDAEDVPTGALRDVKLLSEFLDVPIVGVASSIRGEVLREGVVYKRDEVNFVSLATLAKAFRDDMPTFVQIRGRRYAFVNGKALRDRREEAGLSLSVLSQMLSVSRETVYRYEKEELSVPEETAIVLAEYFDGDVLKRINIFSSIRASPIDKASRSMGANTYKLEQSHPNGIKYEEKPAFIVKDGERREKTEILADIFGVEVITE